MTRAVASLLVLISLNAAVRPVAQALSGRPEHACCLRHLNGRGNQQVLNSESNGNCCPPLITRQSGSLSPIGALWTLPLGAGVVLCPATQLFYDICLGQPDGPRASRVAHLNVLLPLETSPSDRQCNEITFLKPVPLVISFWQVPVLSVTRGY